MVPSSVGLRQVVLRSLRDCVSEASNGNGKHPFFRVSSRTASYSRLRAKAETGRGLHGDGSTSRCTSSTGSSAGGCGREKNASIHSAPPTPKGSTGGPGGVSSASRKITPPVAPATSRPLAIEPLPSERVGRRAACAVGTRSLDSRSPRGAAAAAPSQRPGSRELYQRARAPRSVSSAGPASVDGRRTTDFAATRRAVAGSSTASPAPPRPDRSMPQSPRSQRGTPLVADRARVPSLADSPAGLPGPMQSTAVPTPAESSKQNRGLIVLDADGD